MNEMKAIKTIKSKEHLNQRQFISF